MPLAFSQFSILTNFAIVVFLTVGVQFVAWRLRLPLLLTALGVGVVTGPALRVVHPELLFGDWLVALVVLLTGFLLFEQGLRVRRFSRFELGVSAVHALITWVVISITAERVLKLPFPTACFLGAALSASGPVLLTPLFRDLSLRGALGPLLRAESAVTEIISLVLVTATFLFFDGVQDGGAAAGFSGVGGAVLGSVILGGGASVLLHTAYKRELLPDFLRAPTVATVLVGIIAVSSLLQPSAGLLTAALFGLFLARSPGVWSEMRDEVRIFLVTLLAILLAARLEWEVLDQLSGHTVLFFTLLCLLARPLAVLVATLRRNELIRTERVFLGAYAPRGVLPLVVAYLFSAEFREGGVFDRAQVNAVIPVVVFGTVLLYHVLSPLLARALSVAEPHPNGVLLVGAHPWAREMALALMKAQYRVLVVDTNQLNILAARKEGIPARCANVFLDRSLDEVALDGFGFLFAVTSNDEVNTLAAIHFADIFGSDRVFQLSLDGSKSAPERFLKHVLFGRTVTFQYLQERFSAGAVIRSVPITQELDILGLHEAYGKDTVPLFALGKDSELAVFTPDRWPVLTPGHTLVCLMAPDYVREGEPSSEDVPPPEQKGRIVYLPREGS